MGQHVKNQTNLNNQISVNMNSGISVGLYHGFFATNNYSGIDDEIFQRNEFRSDTLIIGIRRKWKNLLGTMITAGRTFTKGNYRLEDRVTFSVPHILEIDRKFNDKWLLRMGLSIGNVVLGFERAFYGYAVDPDDYFYRYLRYSTFKSFLHYSGRHFSIQAEDIDGETMFIAQTRKLYIDHLRTKYGVSPFVAGEVIITGGREYQYSAAISTNIQTGINAILLKNRLNIDIVYEWIPYDHQPYLTFNLLVNVL
jgi:hypothetical protein